MAKQTKTSQPEPTAELAVVIPAELTPAIQNSKIEINKAQSHAIAFAPSMQEYIDLSVILNDLDKVNPSEMDAKRAREARLKMVKVRTGAEDIKDLRKEGIKAEGDLIQALYNVVKNSCVITETEFAEIEKHQERQEAKRKSDLFDTRKAQLEPFGTDTTYLPLGDINEDQFARILENEQLAFNARKETAEKLELARIESERIAEANRLEMERLQAEMIEAERLESIRVKEELAMREKELAAERESARIEQERRDAELAKEREAAILEQERIAKENEVILAKERETSRIAAEKLAAENEAKLKAEQERLEKVAAQQLAEKEKQTARQSAMFALGLQWDGQMFHYQDINFHWTDLLCMDDAEFDKNLKGATKRMEVLKAENLKKEQELEAESLRLKKELQAKKDAEAKESESKRLAQLAPDKEKINAMYLALRDLELPAFTSPECQQLAAEVKNRISHILSYIKEESKKLS